MSTMPQVITMEELEYRTMRCSMGIRELKAFFLMPIMVFGIGSSILLAQENTVTEDVAKSDRVMSTASAASTASWLEFRGLTEEKGALFSGKWGRRRISLKEKGITIQPRLAQFYQGISSGDGDHGARYGSKLDALVNVDLSKFGMWEGLSLNTHSEYNFGQSLNGRGGTVAPINTALQFPGMEGADALDLSSLYLKQNFNDTVWVAAGKINIIDIASSKQFMGGAGVDSFWNAAFAAPPSGTVPPYLFGALMSVKTEIAMLSLWVYDPNNAERSSCLDNSFKDGYSIRPSIEFPVTIAGLKGHQGFAFAYSNKEGTDLGSVGDTFIPGWSGNVSLKTSRYYGAYSFDQYLYQSEEDSEQGFGVFGQFGLSDGNPNRLYWLGILGIGGQGLIHGRSRDNWGVGCYYASISPDLKDSLEPMMTINDEKGMEIFYNFEIKPWFDVGLDLQIINSSLEEDTVVVSGLRTMLRF